MTTCAEPRCLRTAVRDSIWCDQHYRTLVTTAYSAAVDGGRSPEPVHAMTGSRVPEPPATPSVGGSTRSFAPCPLGHPQPVIGGAVQVCTDHPPMAANAIPAPVTRSPAHREETAGSGNRRGHRGTAGSALTLPAVPR